MRRIPILLFGIIILLTMILPGCKGADGPQGPAGPTLTGNLVGWAYLTDSLGNRLTNHVGIRVSIDGQTTSSMTDSTGKWVLSGLKSGTFTISWSKTSYGTRKAVGYQFIGGGEAYYGSTSLYLVATWTIDSLSASRLDSSNLIIAGKFSGPFPWNAARGRLFFGTSNNVSSNPANYLYSLYFGSDSLFSASVATRYLYAAGILKNSTVYIIAYGDGISSSSYTDLTTGRAVYTTLGPTPSNVVSVIVP